jgi:hypothetical protein
MMNSLLIFKACMFMKGRKDTGFIISTELVWLFMLINRILVVLISTAFRAGKYGDESGSWFDNNGACFST